MGFMLIAIVTIFWVGYVGGILPTRISVTPSGEWLLTMGNIFSGGVFLGGGLMHLLPEGAEMFHEVAPDIEFPLGFLVAGIGFGLVLFIEKVLLKGEDVGTLTREYTAADLNAIIAELDAEHHTGKKYHSHEQHGHGMPAAAELSGLQWSVPFILTFVLATHALIAGMAFGLEGNVEAGLVLLIAILAHKGFEAFAIGLSLKESGFNVRYIMAVIAFFACMTPLGIIVGSIFSNILESDTALWVQATFNALAGGTFLYVAVIEIIQDAFETRGKNGQQFVFMSAGFALMAVLAIWG